MFNGAHAQLHWHDLTLCMYSWTGTVQNLDSGPWTRPWTGLWTRAKQFLSM